jgi:hypothetical protein
VIVMTEPPVEEFDVTIWMPDDMDEGEKEHWASAYPTNPHKAAGMAWESWAAQLADDEVAVVSSVSTGAQSVSYAQPTSAHSRAVARANWHFSRMPGAVRSPDYPTSVGPTMSFGWEAPTWPRSLR